MRGHLNRLSFQSNFLYAYFLILNELKKEKNWLVFKKEQKSKNIYLFYIYKVGKQIYLF
jgi:hypothetical protein